MENNNKFGKLKDDLKSKVFTYLDPKDTNQIKFVSKKFKKLDDEISQSGIVIIDGKNDMKKLLNEFQDNQLKVLREIQITQEKLYSENGCVPRIKDLTSELEKIKNSGLSLNGVQKLLISGFDVFYVSNLLKSNRELETEFNEKNILSILDLIENLPNLQEVALKKIDFNPKLGLSGRDGSFFNTLLNSLGDNIKTLTIKDCNVTWNDKNDNSQLNHSFLKLKKLKNLDFKGNNINCNSVVRYLEELSKSTNEMNLNLGEVKNLNSGFKEGALLHNLDSDALRKCFEEKFNTKSKLTFEIKTENGIKNFHCIGKYRKKNDNCIIY